MVEEEALADLCAGMDVDGGEEAGEMVHEAREEIELALPQPVRNAVEAHRQHSRIEQNVPTRARGRIAGFDGVEIGEEPRLQATSLLPLLDRFKCSLRQMPALATS